MCASAASRAFPVRRARAWSGWLLIAVAACPGCSRGCDGSVGGEGGGAPITSGDGGSAGGSAAAGQGGTGGAGGTGATAGAGGGGAGASGGGGTGGGGTPTVTIQPITDHHRFIEGVMFGGWGPHLGHLVRAAASATSGEALWFVDDYCAQPEDVGAGCDVMHDHTLGYFEHTAAGWALRHTVTIPGQVQQNTATIAAAGSKLLHSYGVDIAAGVLRECSYSPMSGPAGCGTLPFALGPASNYIGAAISPPGYRMVWWTGVVDGGGGSFHYVVDYGSGWNGPRSGSAGGYNDASYINIAFGGGSEINRFTMHVQLVSGYAPNWGFLGAVGQGDLGTTEAVGWSNALAPVGTDPMASTNDVWIDPASNDAHLVARSEGGQAVYYHRPAGGGWSPALFALAGVYRARLLWSGERLMLLYGPGDGGLAYRVAAVADREPGKPIDWAALPETLVALPDGFGQVFAIYPESPAYQTVAADGFHAAVVGATEQHVVTHVAISLPD